MGEKFYLTERELDAIRCEGCGFSALSVAIDFDGDGRASCLSSDPLFAERARKGCEARREWRIENGDGVFGNGAEIVPIIERLERGIEKERESALNEISAFAVCRSACGGCGFCGLEGTICEADEQLERLGKALER